MNSAEEFYYKSIAEQNLNWHEYTELVKILGSHNEHSLFELMEAYADHVLQSKINISDGEIAKEFNSSKYNLIHPDRFRAEGAKWLRGRLLNK